MFIIPMTGNFTPLESIKPIKEAASNDAASKTADGASFIDVFRSIYDNVVETNEQTDRDAIDVMLGNIDDLATVQANIEKASVAVDLLVTVKNQALSAYNEIIKMQV